MILNSFLFIIAVVGAFLLLAKRIRNSKMWLATVTPLASIIGSGFLVIVPLLGHNFGAYAPFAMFVIVVVAYAVGGAIRYNIRYSEPLLEHEKKTNLYFHIHTASSLVLGFAYVISVAFYLRLLSAFLLKGVSIESDVLEKIVTSGVLIAIGIVGKVRGLSVLERLEEYSVSIKLSIIMSLIVGWGIYNFTHYDSDVIFSLVPKDFSDWHSLRVLAGALIVVQGFETSRYLGSSYSTEVRIKTMKMAQWISGGIYVIFVMLTVPTFPLLSSDVSDTAIISLSKHVAPILPVMLIVAALMSQFSAAVADTISAGGLITSNIKKHLFKNESSSYLFVTSMGVFLIWTANIFEIIAFASRAFALYYALQCVTAAITVKKVKASHWLYLYYFFLAFILFVATIIALPAD